MSLQLRAVRARSINLRVSRIRTEFRVSGIDETASGKVMEKKKAQAQPLGIFKGLAEEEEEPAKEMRSSH